MPRFHFFRAQRAPVQFGGFRVALEREAERCITDSGKQSHSRTQSSSGDAMPRSRSSSTRSIQHSNPLVSAALGVSGITAAMINDLDAPLRSPWEAPL